MSAIGEWHAACARAEHFIELAEKAETQQERDILLRQANREIEEAEAIGRLADQEWSE